jgi:hypothetical protein
MTSVPWRRRGSLRPSLRLDFMMTFNRRFEIESLSRYCEQDQLAFDETLTEASDQELQRSW